MRSKAAALRALASSPGGAQARGDVVVLHVLQRGERGEGPLRGQHRLTRGAVHAARQLLKACKARAKAITRR